MTKYHEIINRLKGFAPEIRDKEFHIQRIMDRTMINSRKGNSIYDFIFGWFNILWLRRSLAAASVFIVLFFVFQQFVIVTRIGSLEKRMIEINTENILENQKENVIVNAAMFRITDEFNFTDSIKVAQKDLKSLVGSYRDLQKRYNELQDEIRYQKGEALVNPGSDNKIKL